MSREIIGWERWERVVVGYVGERWEGVLEKDVRMVWGFRVWWGKDGLELGG